MASVDTMRIPLTGRTLVRLVFDRTIEMQLTNTAGHRLTLHAAGWVRFDNNSRPIDIEEHTALCGLLDLQYTVVTHAQVGEDGTRILHFGSKQLQILPHPEFEAWELNGPAPEDIRIICMPGGKLAIWNHQAL